MKTLTIKTTEGRTLETSVEYGSFFNQETGRLDYVKCESVTLTVEEIRQLWPDEYQSDYRAGDDYTVIDEDGDELKVDIMLDNRPTQWYGEQPTMDRRVEWGAWGVDAEGDGNYTLYVGSEGEGESITFAASAEFVIAELQRIAYAEEGWQDALDSDEQDYGFFNYTLECIADIKKLKEAQKVSK